MHNLWFPVAGLDPATHVLFDAKSAANEDVDDRVKPGQGAEKWTILSWKS